MNQTTESAPMKDSELGQYVCVAQGGCLYTPNRTIRTDGVWVKTGQQWSSAHRVCHEAAAHLISCTPQDDGSYLVTCSRGCNLGNSASQPDEAGAQRRADLHHLAQS